MARPGLLLHIINAIADPIFVKDERHQFVLVNEALCRLLGRSREQLLGKSDHDVFPKAEADIFMRHDDEVFATGQETLNEERVTDASGALHVISTKKNVFLDTITLEKLIVGVIRDVTQQKQTEEKLAQALVLLQQLSSTDALTGLNNRRGFLLVGQQQLKTAARLNKHACLLFLDLDNLKHVNDTLGHGKGDELIVETARMLERFFRTADVLGRLGGDEFVALAIIEAAEDATRVELRLQEAIATHNAVAGVIPIAVSIGVAHYAPDRNVSLEALLCEADEAMYRVKRTRRASLADG